MDTTGAADTTPAETTPADAAPAPSARERQLAELLWAFGEVVGHGLDPAEGLERLSATTRPLVPHDWVDIVWLEEGGTSFLTLHGIAALPASERPGRPEAIDGSGLEAVFRDGEPLVAVDVTVARRGAPRERRFPASGRWSRLAVPMRLGQRVTGLLEFRRRVGAYTATDVEMARVIAAQLAPLVEVTHRYRMEQVGRAQLATVVEVSRAISASLDLDVILPVIGHSLTETLGLPTCAIYLYDEARRALMPHVAYGRGDLPPELDGPAIEAAFYRHSFPIDEPPGAGMCALREPLVIDDPREHPWVPADFLREVPFVAVMDVPFVVRDHLVALAALPVWEAGRGFTARQLDLAMGIGQAAAVAIEHARLYRQARELGVAEERNRLAREVHDTLAQGLTAIALQLEAAERLMPPGGEANRLVAEARALARRSLGEARRAVWGLSPTALDGRSLPEALANETAAFGQRTGLAAGFSYRGDADPPLEGDQAAAMLRIAQEALHNVEKHAAATRVRVELEYRPGRGGETPPKGSAGGAAAGGETAPLLALLVADDGQGFDQAESRPEGGGGFGIVSMRERLRLVGGELEIESAPGWGTRVRAHLPLRDGDRSQRSDAANGGVPQAADRRSPTPIRILLVDDHPLAREGIRRLLAGQQDAVVVGEASDGVEGVERALALRPDVVLMDLQMPRLGGVGAVRALRESWPEARVLILTTFAGDEALFEALRAGARGYLLKDAGAEELADALRTVHEGGSLVQPVMATRLLDRFGELATRELGGDGLTERELDVLRLVAAGSRNREIAEQLVVTEKTVKYHLGLVYAKLGVSGRTEAVARARELGLLPLDALPTG